MTEVLNLIRLPVHLDQLWRLAADRSWFAGPQHVFDEGLALHHALGEVFGPAALRPFRLMVPPQGTNGFIYAYSRASEAALRDNAALCGPEYAALFELALLQSKNMPVDFPPGRTLGFDLRVRPIRRSRSGDKRQGAREIDVFQHEAEQRFPDSPRSQETVGDNRMTAAGRSREQVYGDWLAEKLDGIATTRHIRLVHFKRLKTVRDGKVSEGPDAVLQGECTITDPQRFAQLLANGIGRHKTYGFGMLLLRPARLG